VPVDRTDLIARYPFPLDRFQLDAFEGLDAGRHVIVAAPTGSGKTVVAEYGIELARRSGRRAFYTAPIKALSNQKYRDLLEIHGPDEVGLLTGDNSINGDAGIVVMTTEVLRNMIYGGRRGLDRLGVVVLDEVHFLQDTYRGPVWEEVIIHLPREVQLICLSATVSNVAELAEWVTTVRGPTEAVVEERRPVRLRNHYLADDRTNGRLQLLPVFVDGRPNRAAAKLDQSAVRGRGRQRAGAGKRILATPRRVDTVELLHRRELLPAIYFIFSRAQCDDAARQCADAGLVLTDEARRAEIREIAEERLAGLAAEDREVLGVDAFLSRLEAGFAAHHAGMVPPMKEAVELCFVRGLVRVVFATETLAVGINMPARSVVIEKLSKFTGDHHEMLTPGEYTQLTGRAGRRGIDDEGDAVVLWSPWTSFDEVAQLASSSRFHLRSAFRPTYNMAVNLVRTYSSEEAHHLLNLSFAQFQADREVVRLERRLDRQQEAAAQARRDAESPFGDLEEYRALRQAEREQRREDRARRRQEGAAAVAQLRPGTVLRVEREGRTAPAVVTATAHRKRGLRLTMVDRAGASFTMHADDFAGAPQEIGAVKLPHHLAPNRREYRAEVARRLRTATGGSGPSRRAQERRARGDDDSDGTNGSDRPARADLHPVAADPDLRERLGAASRAERVEREIRDLERRVRNKHHRLSDDFDRVLDLLSAAGYVDLSSWTLTADGEVLASLFHECDLLVAQTVRDGLLDGLPAEDVAALVSCLVYEHRSAEAPPAPWFSDREVHARWRAMRALSLELAHEERTRGLAEHRAPDPTFAAVAHAWVSGEGFAEVVVDEELTGGDFVRTVKQLIDLLRQVAIVAPDPATRRAAAEAVERAFRGIVADSSAIVGVAR